MPNEYEEMRETLRNMRNVRILRWKNLMSLFEWFCVMFSLLCLTEWNTLRLYDLKHALTYTARFSGEVVLYGSVVVPCMVFAWILMMKGLALDWRKIGFRIGSLLRGDSNLDSAANG